jgi:hypothetical protein
MRRFHGVPNVPPEASRSLQSKIDEKKVPSLTMVAA